MILSSLAIRVQMLTLAASLVGSQAPIIFLAGTMPELRER
jgi:hypothetical protein